MLVVGFLFSFYNAPKNKYLCIFFKCLSGATGDGKYFGTEPLHFEGEPKTEAGEWISGLAATDLASSPSSAKVTV